MRDKYNAPVTYTYPNATIRVYSPIITDEERAARMKQVYAAAEKILKECKS